jgi:hypothetical protein
MRAVPACLMIASLLAFGKSAKAAARVAYTSPADTISWWIDAGAAPAAFVDTTLEGALDIRGLRNLRYPNGRGEFQKTPYDTQTTLIGSARYDMRRGTISMRLPNADFSRMRLSCTEVFEMRPSNVRNEATENELQDAAITLIASGGKPDSLHGRADVLIHLTVTDERHTSRPVIRSLHPSFTSGWSPADTISIPWHARPGDRIEIRVAVDASGHGLAFHGGRIAIDTRLMFEGLLNGVTVRSVRWNQPPRRIPGDQIREIPVDNETK